jgi:putative phosphoesterase
MRILVVSDTHSNEQALYQAIEEQPTAKLIFHLGDGIRDAENAAERYPDREFRMVKGNCDWGHFRGTDVNLEIVGRQRVFMTHGHRYNVKMGMYRVTSAAREQNADILLFGHTHQPLTDYEDGLTILNPGSLSYGHPTYGLLDITEAGVVPLIVSLRY